MNLMKKLVSIFLLFPFLQLFAQGVVLNTGGVIVSSSSAHIIIGGNGNFTNNGTVNFEDGNWLHFSGNNNQSIAGSSTISFSNIDINSVAVNVARNIDIRSSANMSNGFFDLKNATVILSPTATITGGETNTKRIRATDGSGNEGQGNGTIQITVNNPSGDIANLGVDFTPTAALGTTTIIRGHKEMQGDGAFVGNYSIYRNYTILPTNQQDLTINRLYFFTDELGSQSSNSGDLQLFQMYKYGSYADYWQPRTTTVNPSFISSDVVVSNRSSFLFTLGSKTAPLPVELVSFNPQCDKDGVVIRWQTATEINAAYFSLEKSVNGIDFSPIAQINAQGNSNNLVNYQFIDQNSNGISYYRLVQYDFNGDHRVYSPKSINCSTEENEDVVPIYQNDGNLLFNISGKTEKPYQLRITNSIGQIIVEMPIMLNSNLQTVSFNQLNMAQGMYYISLFSEEKMVTKRFVVHK